MVIEFVGGPMDGDRIVTDDYIHYMRWRTDCVGTFMIHTYESTMTLNKSGAVRFRHSNVRYPTLEEMPT